MLVHSHPSSDSGPTPLDVSTVTRNKANRYPA